ncbi:hypothetical protein H1P_110031 [Hyella patelloides LEGE 07179]|uniref:Uncharacterized protein n=1 Tax=Hyella patelloides LEGE 07179 TaxID=945734 RepID=A0A563VJK1_9CYAN|nr:hypothetical protein H1P_110031 [Hyella patelloides LEGE 07179]
MRSLAEETSAGSLVNYECVNNYAQILILNLSSGVRKNMQLKFCLTNYR